MNQFIESQWWPMLGEVLLKSTLLLLAVGIARWAWRTPAFNHRIGALAFAGLLLLPFLSAKLSFYPVGLPIEYRDMPSQQSLPAALPVASSSKFGAEVLTPLPTATAASSPSALHQVLALIFFTVWVLGVAFFVARTAAGFIALHRLQAAARYGAESNPIQRECAELAPTLGIGRPVHVVFASGEDIAMPITWGWRAPVILLPAEAANWQPDRVKSVLLHELTHIRRGDWAAQCLAALVCALYWFHPLVWVAAARLKTDAELATDEQVVASGIKASEYCRHLLELARLCSGAPIARFGVPMTRRAGVERRLRRVLDGPRPRRGLARMPAPLITAGFGLALLVLATLQFRVQAGTTKPTQEAVTVATSSSVNLPDLGSVEFLGVSTHPSLDKKWWTMEGQPLPANAFVITGARSSSDSPDYKTREFVAALHGLPVGTSWRWKTEPGTNWASGDAHYGQGMVTKTSQGTLIGLACQIPANLSALTVKIGVAGGPWHTLAENSAALNNSTGGEGYQVMFAKGTEDGGDASVTVSHTIFDQDVRITAVDLDGIEHPSSNSSSTGNDAFYQATCSFSKLPLSRVRTFRVETRHFNWVEFPNVPLAPR